DMIVSGPAPIVVRRTYRTFHPQAREFGRGTSHTYGVFLYSAREYEEADLYLPDELPVHYVRMSPGTAWYDAVFKSTSREPDFSGSTLAWNGAGWDLDLTDGSVLVFGDRAPLQGVRYANGGSLSIRRQGGDPNGSIQAVVA